MINANKKYNIIYVDPPWEFKVWSKKGPAKSASNHYQTMPLSQLKTLSIPTISNDDAVLLMWATAPAMKEAFDLGNAWGFTYKTVAFVWVKMNKSMQSVFTGLGYYTRANSEFVLLFTKGKPLRRINRNVGQVVICKVGKHSVKPPEVRERIVQLFGNLPRIELFARDRAGFFPDYEYEGWDVFGNEISNSIKL